MMKTTGVHKILTPEFHAILRTYNEIIRNLKSHGFTIEATIFEEKDIVVLVSHALPSAFFNIEGVKGWTKRYFDHSKHHTVRIGQVLLLSQGEGNES